MDKLESLGSQLSQITLYDIKSYYNQAKNMVLNVSEMEAKVREATNDEPWGASSTLMQEIAQGTFNFQQFNEIMPCIYSRFMEKEAKQWREIYKALQLLEYIIKHGSERVVDDARSHLSTIKMLRNFHYIDEKGKDQGINVRNRALEISALLSDLEKIRGERRKAKANRNKYIGTGNDGFGSGRYGGYGSDSLSGGSGGTDNYYGSGGGGSSSSFRDDAGRKGYDEYDAGDYEESSARRSTSVRSPASPPASTSRPSAGRANSAQQKKEKEKEKPVPVDDLLGDWGEDSAAVVSNPSLHEKALPAVVPPSANDGDDFDDFQSAPISPPAAPLAFSQSSNRTSITQAAPKPNVFDFLNQSQPLTAVPATPIVSHTQTQQSQAGRQQQPLQAQTQAQPARPNYFGSTMGGVTSSPISPVRGSFAGASSGTMSPAGAARPTSISAAPNNAGKSSANFDDLWSLGLGTAGKTPTSSNTAGSSTTGKSIKDLEREKALAGIWGTGQGHKSHGSMGGGFGNFGGASAGGTSNSGGDDLLL